MKLRLPLLTVSLMLVDFALAVAAILHEQFALMVICIFNLFVILVLAEKVVVEHCRTETYKCKGTK